MCGILGGWLSHSSNNYKKNIERAMDTLKNRGPDDNGYEIFSSDNQGDIFLGHTRLSIIDLSHAAHQPMSTFDGRFSIVFNGEIYNYRELRFELTQLGFSFVSSSDTEVLLIAWLYWGEACLSRLSGMFAFVIYDKQESTLTCVRDAFGIKPFFYYYDQTSFLFGSTPQTLLALRGGSPQMNIQRCYDYLVFADYDSQEQTFFEGINQLLPGQLMMFDVKTRACSVPKYFWRPSINAGETLSFKDAAEKVRELFLSNIRLHLRSDVPLGVTLSGGIDSSAVICAMRHIEPDAQIHSFSFIAENTPISEEKWIDHVNSYVNAIPHKVFATASELEIDIDDMICAQGEPFGSTSIYAQYRVFKLAKEFGVTVTLDGQGADELLAGYQGYPMQRIWSLLDEHKFLEIIRFLQEWSGWPDRGAKRGLLYLGQSILSMANMGHLIKCLFAMHARPNWINSSFLKDNDVDTYSQVLLDTSTAKGRRVMEKLAFSLQQKGLPELLRHGDRNSMRFSIESRVPFLTIPMVDQLFSLPEEYLISKTGETKAVFREAMRGIVPDLILDRKDKIGFATPEKGWLLAMAPKIRMWLNEGSDIPLLDMKPLLDQFDRVVSGKEAFSWQVWRWVNFVRWHQQMMP